MNHLQTYFNGLANRVAADGEIGGASSHNPDIGANRERPIREFLERHLPAQLKTWPGGQVLGKGGESRQMDIIVSNDLAPRFDVNDRTFTIAETVAAAVSIKSRLDKAQVENALSNLASVPQASPEVLAFPILKPRAFADYSTKHPALYVFAYNGIDAHLLLDHVTTFYGKNGQIPENRIVHSIFVNRAFCIKHCRAETRTVDGTIIGPGTFHLFRLTPETIGYPFIAMLGYISNYLSFVPFMSVTLHPYLNQGIGIPWGREEDDFGQCPERET